MRYLLFIYIFFIISCQSKWKEDVIVSNYTDTLISNSNKIHDSSTLILKLADKKTEKVIKQVEKSFNVLQNENQILKKEVNDLKETIKITKSTIIRDTVFITEKKNFWGKTKTSIDSSKQIIEDSIKQNS